MSTDTIVAIATPSGHSGVGIVRFSGPFCSDLAKKFLGFEPIDRQAHYCDFKNESQVNLDQGIALFFKGPNSFTGEDVLELQGHGGPVILDMLVQQGLSWGARLARPGEFSERAFLNNKMDLTQAEAIADLIAASSKQAAKQALNSLQGEFSQHINYLVEQLIQLRLYVEAAIDFPEEEVDFLSDSKIAQQLEGLIKQVNEIEQSAQQGVLIREGMSVVIVGRPNAGKSSLLNALTEKDIAIVTDIAGTTRDLLREQIHIDGMPLHIVDTAGLRDNADTVEKIGIEKAWQEIHQADAVLLVIDSNDIPLNPIKEQWPELFENPSIRGKILILYNKIDQSHFQSKDKSSICLSAKTGLGLNLLRSRLKQIMGYRNTTEGNFSARRRHLDALQRTKATLLNGQKQLQQHQAGELLAEDLRLAQEYLGEITGTVTADDLLGHIFSSFCIGK